MALPIYGYGKTVLKQKATTIDRNYPDLENLIEKMWQTMEIASGCGLAAPQIGKPIRLFVADSKLLHESMTKEKRETYFDEDDQGIRGVFINPEITWKSTALWQDSEGCLSVPGLSANVERPWKISLRYQNENFETYEKEFTGMTARVLQHEYDHIEGMLYIDRVNSLSKKLMEPKLKKIQKGKIKAHYNMKFN